MFNIDIPSWITPEIVVQGLSIFFGIIFGALLTFHLQKRQWMKEQAEKDMVEVYRPLSEDVSKIAKFAIDQPLTYYQQYPERYLKLKKGRIAPPIYDPLKADMDKLIISWDEVGESFEKFDKKFHSFNNNILENTLINRKDGKVCKLIDYYYPLANKGDVLRGNKEKCISYFKGKIQDIDNGELFEKVDLKQSPEQIIDRLFSSIENEKKDYLSKREKMLKKAEEVKEKLYYKTRYPMKRYSDH